MKTTKVSDLEGVTLDYFVCKAAGLLDAHRNYARPLSFATHWMSAGSKFLHPSTDWANGGLIIERERIDVISDAPATVCWTAKMHDDNFDCIAHMDGPTPLIAAMRCYAASKLGDTVEVPEELQ